MRRLYFLVLVVFGLPHVRMLVSLQASGNGSAPVLAGTVVNSDGRPALGATVWVIGGTYDSSAKIVAHQTTDAQGRFAFQEVKQPDPRSPI